MLVKFLNQSILLIIFITEPVFSDYDIEYTVNDDQLFNEYLSLTSDVNNVGCSFDILRKGIVIKQVSNINIPNNYETRVSLPGVGFFGNNIALSNIKCDIKRLLPQYNSNIDYKLFIDRIIKFLEHEQVKENKGQEYYKGEWASRIVTENYIPLISPPKGSEFYDSNCYVPASIYNILAENYVNFDSKNKKKIITILENARENIVSCKNGDSYAFWHKINIPNRFMSSQGVNVIRAPNHFPLRRRMHYMFTNIPSDADDTAIVFKSLKLAESIRKLDNSFLTPAERVPNNIGEIFSAYIDKDRNNINVYDLIKGRWNNTGAFMTWLSNDELSFSFLPRHDVENIPLRVNEVDCVVNANVLNTLSSYNELGTTKGVTTSCAYIKKKIKEKNYGACDLYYPNKYSFIYSVSDAIANKVECLYDLRYFIIDELIKKQKVDGAWESFSDGDDILHSTVLAVNSLLNLYNGNLQEKKSILAGLSFILNNRSETNYGGYYWKGGMFFSGGPFSRNSLVFKSDAYTTSLVLKALLMSYHKGLIK